jgi:hypothetical protein
VLNVLDGTSTVTVLARESSVPEAAFNVKEEDDDHATLRAPLPTSRACVVVVRLVICCPNNVTLIAPVLATFVTAHELGSMTSNVIAAIAVPTAALAVTATGRPVDIPIEYRHRTALVETQAVAAALLPPMTIAALDATCPKQPVPSTVMLCDPVTAPFVKTAALTVAPSYVIDADSDPTTATIVAATDRKSPNDALHLSIINDDDDHAVDTLPLPPTRPVLLNLMMA